MKALINPNQSNFVVEVCEQVFDVAYPMYWVDCDNSITAYQYMYENSNFVPYVIPQPTAEQNKSNAVFLLQQTDWTSVADVGNPEMSNPYLVNQAEFIAWRSQVRAIAVNPVGGANIFPTKPQEQWSS